MHNTKISQLGWVVAAGLAGILLAGGFQGGDTNKFGGADLNQIMDKSNYGQEGQKLFDDMMAARNGVLEFLNANPVATAEQILKLRTLSVKDKPTAEDKTALEAVKKEILAAKDKNLQLAQKKDPTDQDKALMREYAERMNAAGPIAQRMYAEFTKEMQTWAEGRKRASIDRARAAVAEAAKAGNYTVVYELGMAPYCANDLTDAALKAMNAKK